MSKTEKTQDPIMDMTVLRMWYRDHFGRRFSVVKYADPYGQDTKLAEDVPIYVAIDGQEPELLGTALTELMRYREGEANERKKLDSSLIDLKYKVREIEDRLYAEGSKKKRKFWIWS